MMIPERRFPVVVGCDPGVNPVLCVLRHPDEPLEFIEDTSFEKTRRGNTRRGKETSPAAIKAALQGVVPDAVYVEEVYGMPTNPQSGRGQDITSQTKLVRGRALVEGVAHGLGVPAVAAVSPATWKRAALIRPGVGKDGSRHRAMELFRHNIGDFRRKADHNRAEAALIALFGWKAVMEDWRLTR